jgi:uncharacterized phage infection (PIP) family protein YhgE
VALEALKRLEASELAVRQAIDRLAAVLNQRIDGTNAASRGELNRQTSELRALHGVLKDNQVDLQDAMTGQALKQDEFNLQVVGRLQNLDSEIVALKMGRAEVSRAVGQLREDAQKWLAPMQTSLDQLTRDLAIAQRALRDQVTLIADIQRKADEAQRKTEEALNALRQKTDALEDGRSRQMAESVRRTQATTLALQQRVKDAEEAMLNAQERLRRLEQAAERAPSPASGSPAANGTPDPTGTPSN